MICVGRESNLGNLATCRCDGCGIFVPGPGDVFTPPHTAFSSCQIFRIHPHNRSHVFVLGETWGILRGSSVDQHNAGAYSATSIFGECRFGPVSSSNCLFGQYHRCSSQKQKCLWEPIHIFNHHTELIISQNPRLHRDIGLKSSHCIFYIRIS